MIRRLPKGQKELLKGKVLELVKPGKLTIKAATKERKIRYRPGKPST
ncbi:MAG: hypothetical protein LBB80_02625 [Treponema sp.]|jgi:hypothetical protein|nr:hypothetical protein [Treponema sp.]